MTNNIRLTPPVSSMARTAVKWIRGITPAEVAFTCSILQLSMLVLTFFLSMLETGDRNPYGVFILSTFVAFIWSWWVTGQILVETYTENALETIDRIAKDSKE